MQKMVKPSKLKSKLKSCSINGARFMQPLLPDFLNSFSFPLSFSRNLKKELQGFPSSTVVLTTKGQPHRHWIVEIEGGRHLLDGWKKFCVDNQMDVNDVLVFVYQNNFIFCVSVYDSVTKCERRFSMSSDHHIKLNGSRKDRSKTNFRSTTLSTRNRKRQDSETENATSPVPNRQCQSPSCHITLTSYCIKRCIVLLDITYYAIHIHLVDLKISKFPHSPEYLPKSFAVSSGLRRMCCNMRVIDGKGRSWQVKLNYWTSSGQAYISKGWKQFQAANNLKPKNVISFRLLEAGKCPELKCYISSRAE